MPVTLYLQGFAALVLSGFGAAALAAVGHEGGFPQRYRRTWRATGFALFLIGLSATLQNVHGALAILHGQGSRAWNGYMRVAPAWNHGREAVLFALAALLLASALAPRRMRVDRGWTPALVLLAACAAGSLLGWLQRWRMARRGAYVSGLLPAPVAVRPLIG